AQLIAAAEANEAEENFLLAQVEVEYRDRDAAGTTALREITPLLTDVEVPSTGTPPVKTPTIANLRDQLSADSTDPVKYEALKSAIQNFLDEN
ncbi:hypothetical protein, partial [Acinetobacter baumannii]|uniref:hypothetical protein n=1 Tax=Acinetobacter baumannii TaxID=470 RepID=UPI00289E1571